MLGAGGMVVSNHGGVASVAYVVGQPYQYDEGICNAHVQVALSLARSHEVTSEAGLRQSELTRHRTFLTRCRVAKPLYFNGAR